MNKVHLFKNVKCISRVFYPRYYGSGSKVEHYIAHPRYAVSSYLNSYNCLKYISNYTSVQKKDTDAPNEKHESEKIQKIIEDKEFQSILKDFANDFGVDKETSELLEDIRKNIDCEHDANKISKDTYNSTYRSSTTDFRGSLDHKYKEFSDADSTVIPSYEDSHVAEEQISYHIDQELKPKPFINLKRGITGVFDIDDLIQVLRNENLADISTISMLTDDKDCSCDFFVLVTARSVRHIEAVAETILKLYKKKKNNQDPFVTVQGADDSGWKVIDMGNIVLHIFLEEVRAKYDIESCQLFDLEYDGGGKVEADPMLNIIAEQMEFFNSLKKQSNSSDISKDIS